jgi:hypothetical protein
MRFLTDKEPDNVNETPSHDLAAAAACDDICDGICGLDHHGQELLAKRGQAERIQSCWLAKRCEFCFCIQQDGATSGPYKGERG